MTDFTNVNVSNELKLQCSNVPELTNIDIVKKIYGFEDGKWDPDGLNHGDSYLIFRKGDTGPYVNLFEIISSDTGGALLATDRGLVVQKDIAVGGFLSSNQGAVFLGSGLTSQVDMPKIVLSNSGVSRLNGGGPLNIPAVPTLSYYPAAVNGRVFIYTADYHLYQYISGTGWVDKGPTSDYSGYFDTLYLTKADASTPAHLDLGNLTVHGQCCFDWLRPLTGYNIGMLRNDVMEILVGENRADDSCLVIGYHKDINAGYIQIYGDAPYTCIQIQDNAVVVIATLWVDNFYEYDALDDLALLKNYTTKQVTQPNSDTEVDVIDGDSLDFLIENKAGGGSAWSINKSIGFLFGVAKQHLARTEKLEQRVAALENLAKQNSN